MAEIAEVKCRRNRAKLRVVRGMALLHQACGSGLKCSLRPELAQQRQLWRSSLDVDGHEISGHCNLVESNAVNAGNFGVDSGVVVTEEADAWSNSRQKHIKAS